MKLKLETQQEFVIGGYRPVGDRDLEALLVGYYKGEALLFAGNVRAGLVPHVRRDIVVKLTPLRIPRGWGGQGEQRTVYILGTPFAARRCTSRGVRSAIRSIVLG